LKFLYLHTHLKSTPNEKTSLEKDWLWVPLINSGAICQWHFLYKSCSYFVSE
jgi:hypothetical protein